MASSKSKGAKAQPQKMKKSDIALVEAIVGKMRELVDYYPKVRAFYEGKRPLEPTDFLSYKMREADGLVCLLGDAMEVGIYACELPKEVEARYQAAIGALVAVFNRALADDEEARDGLDFFLRTVPSRMDKQYSYLSFKETFWQTVMIGMALCWREMKIWNEHPKWNLDDVLWARLPISYSRDELRERCEAIARFRREHYHPTYFIASAIRNFKEEVADLPQAFSCSNKVNGIALSFEYAVRQCLRASVVCGCRDEAILLSDYGEWIEGFVLNVVELLHDYFVRRAAKCPKDARALWIEADADLVSFIYGSGDKLDLDADKVIELANRAAKAEWVARRMANGYDDVKIEFPRSGERRAQSVMLDEGQLAALVSARADSRRDVNRIIGEVRKAAAGSDGGCHHRDKAKDKVVQAVIRHLAKPGVVFSVHDACEKVGGPRNASWLYSWCHDHENEIRAQVDILRNAESAFRS